MKRIRPGKHAAVGTVAGMRWLAHPSQFLPDLGHKFSVLIVALRGSVPGRPVKRTTGCRPSPARARPASGRFLAPACMALPDWRGLETDHLHDHTGSLGIRREFSPGIRKHLVRRLLETQQNGRPNLPGVLVRSFSCQRERIPSWAATTSAPVRRWCFTAIGVGGPAA